MCITRVACERNDSVVRCLSHTGGARVAPRPAAGHPSPYDHACPGARGERGAAWAGPLSVECAPGRDRGYAQHAFPSSFVQSMFAPVQPGVPHARLWWLHLHPPVLLRCDVRRSQNQTMPVPALGRSTRVRLRFGVVTPAHDAPAHDGALHRPIGSSQELSQHSSPARRRVQPPLPTRAFRRRSPRRRAAHPGCHPWQPVGRWQSTCWSPAGRSLLQLAGRRALRWESSATRRAQACPAAR